jgi:hypothetical protein
MPLYLYHKKHKITGLNYFGKTDNDPINYNGSGVYWNSHLRKHGKLIETVQVWEFDNINEFCLKMYGSEKKIVSILWQKILDLELVTFDSIRKLGQMNHWCKNYLDSCYDLIFIDESQDFDNIMLKILLDDTTVPKLFVGDPRQAIYEWKGCINAFEKLPKETIMIEFYSE